MLDETLQSINLRASAAPIGRDADVFVLGANTIPVGVSLHTMSPSPAGRSEGAEALPIGVSD